MAGSASGGYAPKGKIRRTAVFSAHRTEEHSLHHSHCEHCMHQQNHKRETNATQKKKKTYSLSNKLHRRFTRKTCVSPHLLHYPERPIRCVIQRKNFSSVKSVIRRRIMLGEKWIKVSGQRVLITWGFYCYVLGNGVKNKKHQRQDKWRGEQEVYCISKKPSGTTTVSWKASPWIRGI